MIISENIKFESTEHLTNFDKIVEQMHHLDAYHAALAYLISLDDVIRKHINDIFDFTGDRIKPEALMADWQSGTSTKTTRLAFNLWNGRYKDEESEAATDKYSVDTIFSCNLAPYYWEAIKLRYNYSDAE